MRLNEIFEEKIDEVNMSPGALADFAKTPFAQAMTAGFEAELVVPNAQSDDDDGEQEPDYDQDERCSSTQQIRDFFQGDYNGRRQVDRAVEEIDEKFYEYADEQIMEEFDNEKEEIIRQLLKDDGKTETEIEEIMDDPDNREYQKVYDRAYEEFRDGADYDSYVREFFRQNYPYMSDVSNETGLDWPHWTSSGGSGDGESSEDIASEISDSIGMPVKASSGYHGMKRGTGFFILEPDSSIDYDASNDEAGLELVSPPLPLSQCLEYLDKVFAWAKSRGCTTNRSTGFHMGISIPDQSRENVDHLKFTLFLGDDYVLKQFGRESNTYAKSMMKEMSSKLKNLRAGTGKMDAESMLRAFKDGMNSSAAKFIKTSLTNTNDRYVTVNIKDKYIEVRSAGGDYLDDLDKIKNTLMRYVRAMGLAADPEAEKQEYAKKLYKFLSPMVRGDEDIIKYFTQYSAGTLPSTALKSFIRQAQMKRQNKKDAGERGGLGEGPNLYLFKYYSVVDPSDDPENFTIEVRGDSRRGAMANFRKKFEEGDYNILEIKDINITDDSASQAQARASAQASGLYRITNDAGGYIGTITSDNAMDAYTQAFQRLQAAGMEHSSWRLIAPGGRQIYPDPAFGPTASTQTRYIVTYTHANGGSTMVPNVTASSPAQAADRVLASMPDATVTSVQIGLGPNLLRHPQTSFRVDDIPELPGEFVADPMANAQTYIIKYVDPDGAVQRTAIDANSALQAREWFVSNHPRTYNITDVYRHTA